MSEVIAAAMSAAAAALGYWLVHRVNRRTADTDAAQRQIDQIQEDREADRRQYNERTQKSEERQARLERRLELMESFNRISSDYILALRWHVAEGKPPPPPPFPPELLRPLEPERHMEQPR